MKIRIGKALMAEFKVRGNFNDNAAIDERGAVLFNVLDRATKTKTGISVDVASYELDHLIDECKWFVQMNEPEDSHDDRKTYNNLRNQLKAFQKVMDAQ